MTDMATRLHNVPDTVNGANETEKRLLDSALSVFSEKGYEGASIREIIERANVTRPVLYYYFDSKEHLFCRLVESWFMQVVEDIDRVLAGVQGCRERLRALMLHTFRRAEQSPEVVKLVSQVFLAPSLRELRLDRERLWRARFKQILAIMEEGLASGELSGDNAQTLAMAFSGIVHFYLLAHMDTPELDLSEELAESLVSLFLDGALAPAVAESV